MPTTRHGSSPFLVGIDLGTTNCACAYIDARTADAPVEIFQIPQLIEPFVVQPQPVLPSFLYLADSHEIDTGSLALPWSAGPDAVVGVLARERGAVAPARQVSSAKSWLAHSGVDRRAAILPFEASGPGSASGGARRLSPVDASSRYLAHIRDAWNATVAAGDPSLKLEQQQIVVTVPASFDEEARELTVEAAGKALLSNLTLLEEPIAAFYAWMADHPGAAAAERLEDEQVALVCDVGGGTTDFSLIRVRMEAGAPSFERIAIGDHLLLGGDNVDVTLAALVGRRMLEARPSLRLAITQRSILRRLCSAAKERILGPDSPSSVAITILGAGRSLIGDAITVDLTREDVEATFADFLPITAPGELTAPRDRRGGLRELGLPYETDPAITRHLASFLARSAPALPADHRAVRATGDDRMVCPDLVLFNGGFFTPATARDRVAAALESWFVQPRTILKASHLEAAVALGAATYARLRAGADAVPDRSTHAESVGGRQIRRIKAGSGRAYYVGIHAHDTGDTIAAVCVLARGTEEGTVTPIAHRFTTVANQPISFPLYSRPLGTEQAGDLVSLRRDGDVHEHAPLVTVLRYGRKSRQVELPLRLVAAFTEVGTLELWCESELSDHRWRVQFQLRGSAAEADQSAPALSAIADDGEPGEGRAAEAVVSEAQIDECIQALRSLFSTGGTPVVPQDQIVAHLERLLGYGKTAWPLGAIRNFADALIEQSEGRKQSPQIEARWLNLFGFCVRPGFGAAKDPWRIAESRKIYAGGLVFPGPIQNRVEWLVLWQRAGGGFSAGQQRELAQRVMGELGITGKKAARYTPQMERESWRLLGSLERLEAPLRVTVGTELLRRLRRDPDNASLLWALGRLGARAPWYGPLSSVVPPEHAEDWIDALLGGKKITPDMAATIVQIGARTGDPARDLDVAVIASVVDRLKDAGFDEPSTRPLSEVTTISAFDASRVFGEPLPHGLRLDTRQS
jgi:DNA-K related protein/Hsp70 protein